MEDPATGDRRAWKYTWNVAGLLESVTTPEGERVELRYDPFGRRVEKRVGEAPASALHAFRPRSVTRFVWDGDVLVHEITQRARTEGDPVVAVKTYCFEDDGFAPVAHCDGGGWFHYVNDPIGTPERLVDERGEVACELRREAWGRTEMAPGARTTTAIRFPGQYEDAETGLCYNRFRYYDPDAGRFVSSDPIGLLGGVNSSAYVRNPLRWSDPLGLTDPGLPELIAAFEKKYPGRAYRSGHLRTHSDGRELEIDFETDNAIIEVKGGAGKGLGRQIKDRRDCKVNPTGKPVIGYSASGLGKHSRQEIERQGGIAAERKDLDVLMAVIAPDPK